MTYGDFKVLTRRAASDKILRDKAFNNAKNQMFYKFFDKKLLLVYENIEYFK